MLARSTLAALILLLIPLCSAKASPLSVYYAGFAFAGDNANVKTSFPLTSKLLEEHDPSGRPMIEAALTSRMTSVINPSLSLLMGKLGNYKSGDAVSLAFAVDWENVTTEKLGDKTKVVVDIHAEILVFDFAEMKVIGAFPLGVQIRDVQDSDVSEAHKLALVHDIYYGTGPSNIFDRFVDRLNTLVIKPAYGNRIGVVSVDIEDKARATLAEANTTADPFVSFTALAFSKFLSTNQGVAVLPYSKGQAIGGKMSAVFANGEVYQLAIPEPDYAVHLTVRGFKKVKLDQTAAETAWAYGSYIHVRIDQPELAKTYLDTDFKFAPVKKVPTGEVVEKDWPAYQESLLSLLDQLTKQVSMQDKAWTAQWATGDQATDQLEAVSKILARCR